MNILLLESPRFIRVFQALGCNVLYLGPHPSPDPRTSVHLTRMCHHRELTAILRDRGFVPDAALWCDHGYLPTVLGFEALECPVIGLTIDDYCNPWHIPMSIAFDLVLVAQRDYVSLFEQDNLPRQARWSPLFCDTDVDGDPGLARDIPVSFVGTLQPANIPNRLPFLKRFKGYAPLVMLQGRYAPVFQRSQIVLNQTAAGELNFRLFEAAACGAAVLTEATANGLDELFVPGESILPPYPAGDAAAAAAVARDWLTRPEALRRIAEQGKALVLAGHSLQARARMILEEARRLRLAGVPGWRQQHQARVRQGLATACGFIAAELTQPQFQKMQQTFFNLGRAYPAMWGRL
ncbi:glycosyltransferase family protein [Megalodesulfovibrio gigas]|uniref:Spore protein YkvP/CgeB glycosyl transferase-like domain-containing protein n=1 Tax=Megalodesulfovibrio gigas (strain ATCC 19364 / DSM 1382 / NCIMB 9332 / VKM B-1759) TaxID=1121448 RepID=T2G9G2_MEGG1|nr:glycosyltransferase [Megalodesulfovibrio gigas]AGW12542.1 hypothetical protein DGI_0635 [Megalodesulfovibrio gigas DSM 1382 = ATCC 19364]